LSMIKLLQWNKLTALFNFDAVFGAANLLPFAIVLFAALVLHVLIMRQPLGAKNLDVHDAAIKQRRQEKLLYAVNNAAALLLEVKDGNSFALALTRSMELIRQPLEADQVQLWRASMDDEGLHTNLVSQWLSELGRQHPHIAFTQRIPYHSLPRWKELFLRGECFNGPVANLPPEERSFMEAHGALKSIVIIPVLLDEQFWGFFTINDYATERILSNEEMGILRSASLMIASTHQRVELTTTERETQEALKQRERLLHTVNQTAEILLTASEENTMEALTAGMEIIGKCLDVDRAQIWRNEETDGELYFVMRYEWLSGIGKQKTKIPIGLKVPYSSRPGWLQMFMRGECINGPVSKLPAEENAAVLGCSEMVSLVILPLFLDKKLFGFFSVNDYRREYTFTNDEMDIVASAGLMFTNVFNRNAQRNLARTDALTGVRNRHYLKEAAEQELQNCIEKNLNFSLIMIDIDRFKAINDHYGHPCGDEVLKILTSRIRHVLKHDTLLARYGGEEFVVTLTGVDQESAEKTAWRLQKAIEASAFQIAGLEIQVTASFGVASKTDRYTTLLEIINNADKALYQAKEAGRNTVIGYNAAP